MQHHRKPYNRLLAACLLAALFSLLWSIIGRPPEAVPALSYAPPVLLRLRSGAVDPVTAYPQKDLTPAFAIPQPQLYLVQFSGPIQDTWFDQLTQNGLEIVTYIPDYAYLVWGTGITIESLQTLVPLRWAGVYSPDYAIHPALSALNSKQDTISVTVQLYDHPASDASLREIKAIASDVVQDVYILHPYHNITIQLPEADIEKLASLPGVINVEPALVMQLHDEIQGLILAGQLSDGGDLTGPGYLAWLTGTVGFPQNASSYPIVDVTDDGFDNGTTSPLHPDFYKLGDTSLPSRVMYTVNWTGDASANNTGGHGSLNASIVAGYNATDTSAYQDANGYQYGLGINPFGRIAASKVFANAGGWDAPSYDSIVGQSYNNGARIINNSWGAPFGDGTYTVHDQAYDYLVRDADTNTSGNQEISIIFSAGNAGPSETTIGSPANAKNVISVGASENLRSTWMDGCFVGGSGADNADDISYSSSRGPTADGRIKPELVAPGTHIQGAASQATGYLGNTVCDQYHPLDQTLYAASSGTSHAAPAVASAASLLHWFTKSHYTLTDPSPAMIKAYLVNSTAYMDGKSTGDTLPSPDQGFGRLDIGTAFSDLSRLLIDQTVILKNTGEIYSQTMRIPDYNEPVRITLAWTDAPGSTIGDSYVNNLDLEVQIDGNTYKGNVFSGAISIPGGEADPRNNVESIVLPAGSGHIATIRVIATNIAGDGLPGNADFTDQDFALVCSNCDQPSFAIWADPHSQNVCVSDAVTYTIKTAPVLNAEGTINLNTQQLPALVQSTFSVNPVTIEAQSTLTLDIGGEATPGDFTFNIAGTDLNHGGTITQITGLIIDAVAPDAVLPLAPAHNSADNSLLPTFSWNLGTQAAFYLLELAMDEAFTQPVLDVHTSQTSTTLTQPLAYATEYYWRVTPQNGCGNGTSSATQRFITRQAPFSICSAPGLEIPDSNTLGITDTLSIPAYGDILDMQVQISITHEWAGDLLVTLTHVDTGMETVLLDRPGYPTDSSGCGGQNINITLDDNASLSAEQACQDYVTPAYIPNVTYSPATPLYVHNGNAIAGAWAINVKDLALMDYGTLNGWCLIPTLKYEGSGTELYLPVVFKSSNF